MDIKDLRTAEKADEGATLEVLHPVTDEATGIRLHLSGTDGERYRKAWRRIQNKRLARARKGTSKASVELYEQEQLELLAACTLGWDDLVENGDPVEFTEENAKRVYRDYPWIREKADRFIGERSNFLSS